MNLLNARQLGCLWVGIIAFSLMGLMPPWRELTGDANPLDYAPLFQPPTAPGGVTIDYARLSVEWIIAVAVTGGLLASFHRIAPNSSPAGTMNETSSNVGGSKASGQAALGTSPQASILNPKAATSNGSGANGSAKTASTTSSNATNQASNKKATPRDLQKVRTLSFPTSGIGDLLIESEEDRDYWEFFARAEGQVTVPMGKRVQFELAKSGAANISDLGNLPADAFYSLDFSESAISDGDLRHVAHFTEVRELDLSDTSVTDLGIKSLSGLSKLKKVWLDNTSVTDKGLEELANHREIEKVSLIGTSIDAPAAQSLVKSFSSKCELVLEDNG